MKTINLVFAFAAIILLFSCGNNKQPESNSPPAQEKDAVGGQALVNDDASEKNIVQVAAGSTDHTTLVAAVQAAGLVNVLANNGPLTVFAPTNEAFAALPEGTVEELLKPENKIKLMKIIHYHAAPGTYKGDLLKNDMNLYMATGDNAKIMVSEDGKVTVNGANILATIKASNGVIHVIDKVIFAPEKQ